MPRLAQFRIAVFFAVILASVGFGFVFPPAGAAALGLLLTVILVKWFLFENPLEYLSLPRKKSHWMDFLFAYLSGGFFFFLMCWLLTRINSSYSFTLSEDAWKVLLVVPLQSLFEEVVFRSILLRQIFLSKKNMEWFGLFVVAVFFSFSHLLNYYFSEKIALNFSVLSSLFVFGLAGNLLFRMQRHLGGAWGFHAGWNTLRFSLIHTSLQRNVSEGESFNLLEGSQVGLLISFVLLFCILFWNKKRQCSEISPKRVVGN